MGFLDMIKKGVVEQFTGTISTVDLVLSLITAVVCALLISYIYKRNYTGVSFTKSFVLSLILLAMVTSLVIRTINSNLALSLGMVGALSIVRFRTAVKDPVDTIFMFWSITIGIMSGAGLYLTTIIATLLLGILYSLSYIIIFKPNEKYLLIIKVDKSIAKQISNEMKLKEKCILKTESIKDKIVELTYEISNKKIADEILKWQEKPEIKTINLINID